MRVLLIEDDSATAQSIELMLKSESFNVYTTDLGEEGVDLGKLYDYDIILLDLNLPDMSGYEVLRTLRLSKVKTPILILSGMAGIEDKVRGLGFGADDYMTKPFSPREVCARVRAILSGQVVPPRGESFVIQVGAFSDPAKVRDVRNKLEQAGVKTYTQAVEKDGKNTTRIRVGPCETKEEADKAAARIRKLDLPVSFLKI